MTQMMQIHEDGGRFYLIVRERGARAEREITREQAEAEIERVRAAGWIERRLIRSREGAPLLVQFTEPAPDPLLVVAASWVWGAGDPSETEVAMTGPPAPPAPPMPALSVTVSKLSVAPRLTSAMLAPPGPPPLPPAPPHPPDAPEPPLAPPVDMESGH